MMRTSVRGLVWGLQGAPLGSLWHASTLGQVALFARRRDSLDEAEPARLLGEAVEPHNHALHGPHLTTIIVKSSLARLSAPSD
jgi:hypothetical protein